MGCITAKATLIKEPITTLVSLQNERLNIRFGMICTPNIDLYLRAEPTVVNIPVDGSPVDIQVYTNVNVRVY